MREAAFHNLHSPSDFPYCWPAVIDTRVALIQRSCGYALRPTLSIDNIQRAIRVIKSCSPDCTVVVDNCYGEFTERLEPCHVSLQATYLSSVALPLSSMHTQMLTAC